MCWHAVAPSPHQTFFRRRSVTLRSSAERYSIFRFLSLDSDHVPLDGATTDIARLTSLGWGEFARAYWFILLRPPDKTNPVVIELSDCVPGRRVLHRSRDRRRQDQPSSPLRLANFLKAVEANGPPAVLWFATIQAIECNQGLSDLAPKDCLIPTESIERVVWQIGEA